MIKSLLLTLVILASVPVAALAQSDFWYYDLDGSPIQLEVYDSLVSVRIDPSLGGSAYQAFAYEHESLADDFDIEYLPGGFYLYGIEPGHSLEEVMQQLRLEDDVFMVNPVAKNCYNRESFLSNRLLVLFSEGVTGDQIDSLNQAKGLSLVDSVGTEQVLYVLDCEQKSASDITARARRYYESGLCYVVQPNQMSTLEGFGDPYYNEQWHLENTGQSGGTPDADIDWDLGQQYPGDKMLKVVAVLDYGFEREHEDLEEYWYYWPYDAVGRNLSEPTPDNDPWIECDGVSIQCWHGIAVVGMIKATTGNLVGLAGGDQYVRIMPIKVADANGKYDDESFWRALYWASSSHGPARADICSISLGLYYAPAIEARLKWMYDGGEPVICAAGNYGVVSYPASSPYTLAVGMTDDDDEWVPGSGVGPTLDVVAPGHDVVTLDLMGDAGLNPSIYQCNGDPNYICHLSGTSFAAPIVASLCAKLFAVRPEELQPYHASFSDSLIYEVLRQSSERIQYGATPSSTDRVDDFVGWGRVDFERAMLAVKRGDADNNGHFNVADAVYVIGYIFGGGPEPIPTKLAGDADGNGIINIADAVYLIGYIFGGGPPPAISFVYDD